MLYWFRRMDPLAETDSLAAAYYDSLNQPAPAASAKMTRTAKAPSQGAAASRRPRLSVELPVATLAAVPTPTLTPDRAVPAVFMCCIIYAEYFLCYS